VAGWMVAFEEEKGEKVLQAHSFSLLLAGRWDKRMVWPWEREWELIFFFQRGI
jgi:hypothetical protein